MTKYFVVFFIGFYTCAFAQDKNEIAWKDELFSSCYTMGGKPYWNTTDRIHYIDCFKSPQMPKRPYRDDTEAAYLVRLFHNEYYKGLE